MSGNWSGRRARWRPASAGVAAAAGLALIGTACSSSHHGSSKSAAVAAPPTTVTIALTAQGCAPKPASVPAGPVQFNVANKDAAAVTEAELRTSDLSKILASRRTSPPA